MLRAAISVPANIAEGSGRRHKTEFLQHSSIGRGSLLEMETCLLIAQRLGYAKRSDLVPIWQQAQTVGRLLNGLMRSLEK